MSERFCIADTHFGHAGMIQFVDAVGKPIREEWGRADPERLMSEEEKAERVAAMDEAMVERWNSVVGPKDKVELLGDVVINRRYLPILNRLNGKKRLRMGNHDIFLKDYGKYFEEVSAYKIYSDKAGRPDLVMSHIPLHPASVKERWFANVHGHLHTNRVMMPNPLHRAWLYDNDCGWGPEPPAEVVDPRYLCVSVEHINFTPLHLDEVYQRISDQMEKYHG